MLNVATNDMSVEAVLRDEVLFSSQSQKEHAKLLELGLVDTAARGEAVRQYAAWNGLVSRLESMPTAKAHLEAVKLTQDFRSFETDILDRLNNGQWMGWLPPTFIDHIRREGDYFLQKVTNPEGLANNEICIWLTLEAEHGAFAAHWLDPREAENIRQALIHVGNFEQLQKGCGHVTPQLLTLALQAGTQINSYWSALPVTTRGVKSVIPALMQQHIVREGQRFLQVVAATKQRYEAGSRAGSSYAPHMIGTY